MWNVNRAAFKGCRGGKLVNSTGFSCSHIVYRDLPRENQIINIYNKNHSQIIPGDFLACCFVLMTEPDLLIGRDAFVFQNPTCWLIKMHLFNRTLPADWSRCICLTEPDLLIDQDAFVYQNPTCWLVETHLFNRIRPADCSRRIWLTEPDLLIGRDAFV